MTNEQRSVAEAIPEVATTSNTFRSLKFVPKAGISVLNQKHSIKG